jgi:hypothetical protein
VLYAPPSVEKTTAATALLSFSLQRFDASRRPRAALMVSGPVIDATYFQHMTRAFEASDTPWFDSLLGALSTSPLEELGRKSSLLILDDFDEEGPGEINITFMLQFCKALYDAQKKNKSIRIHVVILTQKLEIANKLCQINNWKKIAPLPGSFVPISDEIRKEEVLPDPVWTLMNWEADELRLLVQRHYEEDIDLSWIIDGMNPTVVMRRYRELQVAENASQDAEDRLSIFD